jgi:hypothetical protein
MTKTKIALAAALVASSASVALAQDFDPNLANRYPAYAGPLATSLTFQSAPVRLQQHRTTPTWAQNWSQHDRRVPGNAGDTSYGGDWLQSYGGGF